MKNQVAEDSLAYLDPEFLASDDARPLRIIAEYLNPLRRLRLQRVHDTIVFFGSARLSAEGPFGRFYSEARELARLIATHRENEIAFAIRGGNHAARLRHSAEALQEAGSGEGSG